MDDLTLHKLLTSQPLPQPTNQDWERLHAALKADRPARPWLRSRRIRWGVGALATLTLALFLSALLSGPEASGDSWSQVHALSQWGSAGADPTWVAMGVESP